LSLDSLAQFIAAGASFSFVMLRRDESANFVRQRAKGLGIADCRVIEIDEVTDGQASTALLGPPPDPQSPFVIYNIDTHVDPASLPSTAVRGAGWIPCFTAVGDTWSFVALDGAGRACEVREKRRISPHATIGLYHFASFRLFQSLYDETYGLGGQLEAGERYVAPMYNALIARGEDVFIHDVLRFDPSASLGKVA
jgi:hypothetical protein